ncbi:MAG TPA: LysR substrate-binding domain-containing protein [Spirochaetia bacterium]|nr:LysR substrate-binding domain-containing protein [Spirochaetia bacterium]
MSEINLYQLKIFLYVARHLGYSRAAGELNLSQPAVSRQVAALEESLGLELFFQKGRQVVLTDAGRNLYDYADRIFDLVGQAERAMSQFMDLERGQVIIGATTTIANCLLPPVIKTFRERFPHIELSLHLGNSAAIEQMVAARELDLGFVGGDATNPALHIEPYGQDELVMITAPEHRLSSNNRVFCADIGKETLICREKGSATRSLVDQFLINSNIIPKKRLEISNTETTKRLVANNIGVAFVSRLEVTTELSTGTLTVPEDSELSIPMHYSIISAKDQHFYPTVLAFLSFARKWSPQGSC